MTMASDQQKSNRKLGLILASVVLVFFVGFMAKVFILSR
jgi:hypothetical protein